MSTTVSVKARAWGATATLRPQGGEHESVDLGANEDRTFHLEPGSTLEISSPFEAPASEPSDDRATQLMTEEVPGRAENDKLIAPVTTDADKSAPRFNKKPIDATDV